MTVQRDGGGSDGPDADRLVLTGSRGVVGRCRDFVGDRLAVRGWLAGADEEQRAVVEDVLLMTSELATNACLHAGGPLEVRVRDVGPRLRVEVVDGSPQPPEVRAVAVPSRPGGHGLRVIGRLSRQWGSEPRGEGKAVWFEVERAGMR